MFLVFKNSYLIDVLLKIMIFLGEILIILYTFLQNSFFFWCLGFEPQTLHILFKKY